MLSQLQSHLPFWLVLPPLRLLAQHLLVGGPDWTPPVTPGYAVAVPLQGRLNTAWLRTSPPPLCFPEEPLGSAANLSWAGPWGGAWLPSLLLCCNPGMLRGGDFLPLVDSTPGKYVGLGISPRGGTPKPICCPDELCILGHSTWGREQHPLLLGWLRALISGTTWRGAMWTQGDPLGPPYPPRPPPPQHLPPRRCRGRWCAHLQLRTASSPAPESGSEGLKSPKAAPGLSAPPRLWCPAGRPVQEGPFTGEER